MLPKHHIFIGFIISIFLFLIFPITILEASIIFLSSFLIDFDHYLFYLYKKKDVNLKNSFNDFIKRGKEYRKLSKEQKEELKQPIFLFHGVEFWSILLILSFVNKIFIFILIGIFIHMTLDYIDLYHRKEPFYKKTSQIMVYIKNKNKKELKI